MTAISYEIEYYTLQRRHVQVVTARDIAVDVARSLDNRWNCRVSSVTRVVDENGRKPKRTAVEWSEK